MSYLDIDNLYKAQEILLFKRCFAMEKIHGTSAHISFDKNRIDLFSGGCNHDNFSKLFDLPQLWLSYCKMFGEKKQPMTIYGEAYGGKLQGMGATYGSALKFVAFEVKIGDSWLSVPKAEGVAKNFGIDFVYYEESSTELNDLDKLRDADSVQAIHNGMGTGHPREGIVLRPLIEVIMNNGQRIIAKHKSDAFRETATPRKVTPDKLKLLTEAKAIADEWVTHERLNHILTSGEVEPKIEKLGVIIGLMIDDVLKESKNEIVDSPAARKEIGRATALMFKKSIMGGGVEGATARNDKAN